MGDMESLTSLPLIIPKDLLAVLSLGYVHDIKSITKTVSDSVVQFYSKEKDRRPDVILLDLVLFGADQLIYPGALLPPDSNGTIPCILWQSCRPSSIMVTKTNSMRSYVGWMNSGVEGMTNYALLYYRFVLQKIGEFISTVTATDIFNVRKAIVRQSLQQIWGKSAEETESLLPQLVRDVPYVSVQHDFLPVLAVGIPETETFDSHVTYIGYPSTIVGVSEIPLTGRVGPWEEDLLEKIRKSENVFLISFGSTFRIKFEWIKNLAEGILQRSTSYNDNEKEITYVLSVFNGMELIHYIREKHGCDPAPYFQDPDHNSSSQNKKMSTCKGLLLAPFVNIRRVLQACPSIKVFVNHGGISSIVEGIMAEKPLLIAAGFGDQPENQFAFEHDMGVSHSVDKGLFRGEPESLKTLFQVSQEMLEPTEYARLKNNVNVLADSIIRQTDVKKAVDFIHRCATTFTIDKHGKKTPLCGVRKNADVVQGYAPDAMASALRFLFGARVTSLLTSTGFDLLVVFLLNVGILLYMSCRFFVFMMKKMFIIVSKLKRVIFKDKIQ
eukprot:GDKK01050385.1.p1 GENE.GDKK01050385.1~~GDKK01050385.1.p1  ORF type:complete len:640 (-),score=109.15 GDKK01050385.1:148-1806(-)